jgi:hypothetical protein
MGEVRSISSKYINQGAFYAQRTKDTEYLKVELNQIGHNCIAFVHKPDKNPIKKSIWIFKY